MEKDVSPLLDEVLRERDSGDTGFSLNTLELRKYVRFQPPFLLIDYVSEVVPGKNAKGYKYFTGKEEFFQGHFPGEPVVPGSLQFEAITQMLNVPLNTLQDLAQVATRLSMFDVKCKRQVCPGDRFDIETVVLSWKRGVCKGHGVGYVNGEVACEADIILTVPAIMDQFMPGRRVRAGG